MYEPPDWTRRHPDTLLVFDTETTLDPAQRLTFGCARLYRPRDTRFGIDQLGDLSRFEPYEEYLFYGDSVSQADLDTIDAFVEPLQVVDYHGMFWDRKTKWFTQGVRSARVGDDGVPILLRSRRDFVRWVFLPMATQVRCLVVGFNLPFDLARLAFDWKDTRREQRRRDPVTDEFKQRRRPWDAFEGGFSLKLSQKTRSESEDTYRPRIAVKTIDSKRHLIQFRGGEDDDPEPTTDPDAKALSRRFRGHFLDLRTLAFALTNESHSLKSACETFGTIHGKDEHRPTGLVTPDELTYGRHDVRATFELADKLLAEYTRHPVSPDHPATARARTPLQATRAYSPASIGKAYLGAMGITPPLERWPSFPTDVLGKAMTAFYGGRAECRIRRLPMPVRYVDFTSMYPTVNGLLGLWELLTAEEIELVEAADEVRDLLASVTLAGTFDAAFWRELRVLVELQPDGEVLPTRGAYEGPTAGWQIGINPLTAERPLWFALPDVVAAVLLSGRAPKILRAIRLVPLGRAAGMQPVALRGEVEIDPLSEDFFARVIERRNALPDREGANKPLSNFAKVLANATSFGIFAEMIRHELPGTETLPVTVSGLGDAYQHPVHAPEEPGAFAFPPLAVLITSAARLMLALLERSVSDAGGSYVMVDTDSMAIVSTETDGLVACPGGSHRLPDGTAAVKALSWAQVERIRSRFGRRLNPYARGSVKDIVKLEDHNFTPAPTKEEPGRVDRDRPIQLHAFAISAKRYALFNLDPDGQPVIRKPSEHGLGHLLNPDNPDEATRAWIPRVWRNLIAESLGLPSRASGIEERPAVARITVSSVSLLRPFATYNEGKPADERIRPFNFLLSANVARLGQPPGSDPAQFHLISRYERDPAKWLRMRWIDRYSRPPKSYAITTGTGSGNLVRVKSIATVIDEYRSHPESKSLDPDGAPCGPDTIGLLGRRPVRAAGFVYIGKEANELDEVEEGLVHDLGDVMTDYGPVDDPWVTRVLPLILQVPTGKLAECLGVDRKTVQRTKLDRTRPHPKDRARWEQAARRLLHPNGHSRDGEA